MQDHLRGCGRLAVALWAAALGSLVFSSAASAIVGGENPAFTLYLRYRQLLECAGMTRTLAARLASIISIEDIGTHGMLLFPFLAMTAVESLRRIVVERARGLTPRKDRLGGDAWRILAVFGCSGIALQIVGDMIVAFLGEKVPWFLLLWSGTDFYYGRAFARLVRYSSTMTISSSSAHLLVVSLLWAVSAKLSLLLGISCAIALLCSATEHSVIRVVVAVLATLALSKIACVVFGIAIILPTDFVILSYGAIAAWYAGVALLVVIIWRTRELPPDELRAIPS
jgi:hypothetical protein